MRWLDKGSPFVPIHVIAHDRDLSTRLSRLGGGGGLELSTNTYSL
jgi:hypothetical protein